MSKYKNTKYGTKTLKMAQKDLWWYKNLCINDTLYDTCMHCIQKNVSLKFIMKMILIGQLLPTDTSIYH